MSETKPRGLHAKLAEVAAEVERIPKRGKAPPAMGGFPFVQVGDAADAIRKALAERGVSMLPSALEVVGEQEHDTKSGGTMTTLEVRMTWTLTDGETGQTATIQSFGAGADTGDKYSGKAQTNAMKYALLMGFLLSTGEDVELSDSSDRQSRRTVEVERADDGGLIGTAEAGKPPADFEVRQHPEFGWQVAFRLKSGRKWFRVDAFGDLAAAVGMMREQIEGQRVTCYGHVREESFTPRGTTKKVTYQVLALDRIATPDFILPASDETPAAASSPAGQPSSVPEESEPAPSEAPSEPMFSEAEEAALDEAMSKAGAA